MNNLTQLDVLMGHITQNQAKLILDNERNKYPNRFVRNGKKYLWDAPNTLYTIGYKGNDLALFRLKKCGLTDTTFQSYKYKYMFDGIHDNDYLIVCYENVNYGKYSKDSTALFVNQKDAIHFIKLINESWM